MSASHAGNSDVLNCPEICTVPCNGYVDVEVWTMGRVALGKLQVALGLFDDTQDVRLYFLLIITTKNYCFDFGYLQLYIPCEQPFSDIHILMYVCICDQ